MFIATLLRKVDAFLRNELPRDPWFDAGPGLVKYEPDLFDRSGPDPWRTRIYWAARRFFSAVRSAPRDAYYSIKYFIQRGRRGWADCDTWSLDGYLNGWMPAALKHLKAAKHGIPCSMFDGLPTKEGDPYCHTDEAYKAAEARWDSIMDRMIGGFEASGRILDGLYEKELGEYPLGRPDGVSRDAWEKAQGDRFKASRLLEERDGKLMEEGMALFIKHYHSLWD
jgi:hypothetical protein